MKLYLISFIIIAVLMSCSKDGDQIIITENFVDPDGDGVETVQEERDGTNPNGPCNYNDDSQIFSRTSETWRNMDCDGDGVSNGKELDPNNDGIIGPEQTNPRSECDYTSNDQDFSITTIDWRLIDCDGDGVINGDEVDPDGNNTNDGNGTNPLDNCDLVISDQTIPPSTLWFELDCDDDCKTNGEEIDQETDPLDGSDFFGSGDMLKEIWFIESNQAPFRKHFFDQQGTRYIKTIDQNGQILADFEYDTSSKLISVEINDSNFNSTTTYEYMNGLISEVTINKNGNVTIVDVNFDGNTIITYDGSEPTGQFKSKITLDPLHQKVNLLESFYQSGSEWHYSSKSYTYDTNYENLQTINTNILGYNPDTGEFYDLYENNWLNQNYEYSSTLTLNPSLQSMERIYFNYLLNEDILNWYWQIEEACTSSSFLESYSYASDYIGYNISYGVNCEQNNHLPYEAYYSTLDYQFDIDIIYE